MSIQLPDGRYRVFGKSFQVGLCIINGRVDETHSSPELHRLAGMNADAFACYARAKKWRLEEVVLVGAPNERR